MRIHRTDMPVFPLVLIICIIKKIKLEKNFYLWYSDQSLFNLGFEFHLL